jgi:hypothetical protein
LTPVGEAEQVQRPRLQHGIAQADGNRDSLLMSGGGAGRSSAKPAVRP